MNEKAVAKTGNLSLRIGVDIGGTFTDMVLVGAGRIEVIKVPSVPTDPAAGVVAALRKAAEVFKGVPGTRRPAAASAVNDESMQVERGCPYSSRCDSALPQCRSKFPDRTRLSESHWVACHLYGASNGPS